MLPCSPVVVEFGKAEFSILDQNVLHTAEFPEQIR
jgi:hypothetical protein